MAKLPDSSEQVVPSAHRFPLLGGGMVVLTGVGWAIYCWRLGAAGEVPTSLAGALPVDPESWYRLQAVWVVPVLLGLWVLMGALATVLLRRPGARPSLLVVLGALGLGWAGPLQTLLILPELVIYEVFGMDAVRSALPLLGLLTLVGCWLGTSLAFTLGVGVSAPRARRAAALVLLLGAVLGGPFLR